MTRDNAFHLHMHPRPLTLPDNQHILDRRICPSHSSSGGLVKDRLQDPPPGINEPVTDLVHGQLCCLRESHLFFLGRVWVDSVLDQP